MAGLKGKTGIVTGGSSGIGFKELPGFLDKKPERTSVLQTLKEKCDAPECNPTVCRKARDEHEL